MIEAKDLGRSIVAVIGGYFVMSMVGFFLTTAIFKLFFAAPSPGAIPLSFLLVNMGCSLLAALLGGYLAAFGAGRAPIVHAMVLAGIVLLLSVISIALNPNIVPKWYSITMSSLTPAIVIAGGFLRSLKQAGSPSN